MNEKPLCRRPAIINQFSELIAAESTRHGGVSQDPYQSLNLGGSTNDLPEHVAENNQRFFSEIGVNLADTAKSHQVHGAEILNVRQPGRYEGYDERITTLVDAQVSVGDYVLTGGELPAMTIIDSIVRLIPGVLGGEKSAEIESFSDGETLEFPQYTRPEEFNGMKVPDVLLSGNHAAIAKWRADNSFKAE